MAKYLNPWTLVISNEKSLKEKLSAIKFDGIQNLMVVTDFDRTMTKNFYPPDMSINRRLRLDLEAKDLSGRLEPGDGSMDVLLNGDKLSESDKTLYR
jgi:hypothetical protein